MPERWIDTLLALPAEFLVGILALIFVAFGVFSLTWPLIFPDHQTRRYHRMVAAWQKDRERNQPQKPKTGTVPTRVLILEQWFDKLAQVIRWSPDDLATKLKRAGYHGRRSLMFYIMAKITCPILFFPFIYFYLQLTLSGSLTIIAIVGISVLVSASAFYAPDLYVKNMILRRQVRIQRAWPDTLDLLHLCVDAGLGLEAAFTKVAKEIRFEAADVADELTLTLAELSYLQDRRLALENLADRTDMSAVREVVSALIQAERYGVAIGPTLRSLASESRRVRIAAAEKKAAALPPRLTVPMIIFFMPVLFAVILAPGIMQVMGLR